MLAAQACHVEIDGHVEKQDVSVDGEIGVRRRRQQQSVDGIFVGRIKEIGASPECGIRRQRLPSRGDKASPVSAFRLERGDAPRHVLRAEILRFRFHGLLPEPRQAVGEDGKPRIAAACAVVEDLPHDALDVFPATELRNVAFKHQILFHVALEEPAPL